MSDDDLIQTGRMKNEAQVIYILYYTNFVAISAIYRIRSEDTMNEMTMRMIAADEADNAIYDLYGESKL